MTKKELVSNIITLAGTEYGTENQLMRKTKEALDSILTVVENNAAVEDESMYMPEEPVTFELPATDTTIIIAMQNDALLRKFDLKKYMGYECPANQRDLGITSGQWNLVHSLEANFKCSIDMSTCSTRGQASEKISRVFDAIAKGQVKARPEAEISKNLESYKKQYDNSPTKAQLSYIDRLEKELGATDSKVISDKKAASERITELLSRKNTKPAAHEEVAVTEHEPMPVVTDMLSKPGFRDRFASMLRRVVSIID